MYKPLSNLDLDKFIKEADKKGVNMFEVNNIKPNTNIDTVFANGGHAILYYDNGGQDVGHFISTLRDKQGNVFFMDSFGEDPDHYSKDILQCFKNNGVKKVSINKKSLQNKTSMTCGRYGIIFTCLNKAGIDPDQMIDFLKDGGKKYGSVDKFILHLFDE